MSQLYSLKQIREILSSQGMHIPDGTLRNYRDDFMDLLPHEGQGRFARYHEDALSIFKDIREFRKVLRLDTDEIRRRLLERMTGLDAQTGRGAAQNAPEAHNDDPETVFQATGSETIASADLLNRAAKTEELAGNIDLRTRYLLDSNTKILSVLQHKYVEDGKNALSLREDFFNAMETLRRDQEALTEEVLEMKYMLKQILNAVSERAAWHNKQDAAMPSLPVEDLEQGYGSEQKQRGFFDKLMKF